MLKKFLHFVRCVVIGLLWSYFFIAISAYIIYKLWNFNFLSEQSWQIINQFWNDGGKIQSGKDYFFFATLVFVPILWILGWRYLNHLSYLKILLYPINAYSQFILRKYEAKSSRIVLKNIKSSQKIVEEIKNEISSIKPENTKLVKNIRQQVNDIITEEIKKS